MAKKPLQRKKQPRKKARSMEKSKDVEVVVTGVSMSGEVKINEHNRTTEENKEQPTRTEICDSREDD
jgi:hypothetical protein